LPAFVVIIYVGIIGAALLYKYREDAAATAANAQPNGNQIALAAAADFDPIIEGEQAGNQLDLEIAQGEQIPFTQQDAQEDPTTASLS
jgi:hypothetical protein